MPAKAAREFIRITGIKCERLLDISNEDCIAEGIDVYPSHIIGGIKYTTAPYKDYLSDYAFWEPKPSFISLYKFANKVKEVPNLWVWAYTFEYLPNLKNNEQ